MIDLSNRNSGQAERFELYVVWLEGEVQEDYSIVYHWYFVTFLYYSILGDWPFHSRVRRQPCSEVPRAEPRAGVKFSVDTCLHIDPDDVAN